MSIGLLKSGIKAEKVIGMQKHVKTKILSVLLVITVVSVGLLGYYFGALGAYIGDVTEVWVQPPFHEASYVIGLYNSSFYYAQNSTTGEHEFLSSNATFVVQSCLDNLPSIGGKVSLVGGNYYLTAPLIFPDKTFTFSGINQHATILYAQINGDYLIKIGDGVALYDNIHIEDAWLRPDSGYTPSGLVFINYSKQINFRRVAMSYLTTAQSYCVYADSSWTIKFFESTFFNTQNCVYTVDGYIYASDTYFDAYDYGGASGEPYHYGVYALNSHGNFHRCTFETNPTTGIGFLGNFTRYSNFIDCHFEAGQNLYDIWLTSNCDRNSYVIAGTGLQNDWYDPSMRLVIVGNSATGNYGWFVPPRIPHPTPTGWGVNQTGFTWYCTTHDLIEMWNGTHIVDLGTGAQGPTGPAGPPTQFGAYSFIIYQNETDGDTEARDWRGTLCYSSSDDDSVFQDCIDDMDAWNEGGIIFVKNGTYTFNTMVTLDQSGIVIQGEANTGSHTGTSVSWSTGTNSFAFKIEASYCEINDLYIDMNELADSSAIWLEDAPRNTIYNVYINETAVDGIYLNSSGGEINSNRIEKCTIRQPGRSGVYIDDDVGHTWVNDCVISDSTDAPKITDYGIYTTSDEKENKFTNNRIWGVMNAICLDDVTAVIVQHNVMTDNDRGILLLQSNNDVLISGNRFWWTNRYDTQAWDNRSDIVFDSSSDQWSGVITGNQGHGQSEARHFLWCSNDNILEQWILDGNSAINYASGSSHSDEYDYGTQSGLTVGDNT